MAKVLFSGNMEIVVVSKGEEYTYPYPPDEVRHQVDKCVSRGNTNGIWKHLKGLDFDKINIKWRLLREKLEKLGVTVCGTLKDWNGSEENGLWVSLEEGKLNELRHPLYDFGDEPYIGSEVSKLLDSAGAYLEMHDGGTGMIYNSQE